MSKENTKTSENKLQKKVWILVENSCEYNDQDYDLRDGGEPIKAYQEQSNADAACEEVNYAKARSGDFPTSDKSVDYYKVVSLVVDDDQVANYKKTRAGVAEVRAKATAEACGLFDEGVAEIFEKYPKLDSFSFKAYTDYFNDGDTCRYHVHCDLDYGLTIKYDGEEIDADDDDQRTKEIESIGSEIRSFVQGFDEDDIMAMFGDHIEVTIDRNGAKAEEYSDHN